MFKKIKSRRWIKFISISLAIILVALLVEFLILRTISGRSANNTAKMLLSQITKVLDENNRSQSELVLSLKQDYKVRAKAVSYILDSKPEAEYSVKELQKIANLMNIDEIHLFDKTGTIYSGTIPRYYGLNFDSGDQMHYFSPMLKNKNLTMCQDVTPNTSEGKNMMYAITWNDSGTRMIQVGIEPLRLLRELNRNELSKVIGNLPRNKDIDFYIADGITGEILGSTKYIAKNTTFSDIGWEKISINSVNAKYKPLHLKKGTRSVLFRNYSTYIVAVEYTPYDNIQGYAGAMLIEALYLVLCALFVLFIIAKIIQSNEINHNQFTVLQSLSEIYYTVHVFNFRDNVMEEYVSNDIIRNIGSRYEDFNQKIREVINHVTDEKYHDKIYSFLNLETIQDRLINKKIITTEFIGPGNRWFRASFISIERDEENKPVRVILATQDINDEKTKEENLIQQSNTDELTSCLNRRAYEEDIDSMTFEKPFVYVSMDVNGLKMLNDSLGHYAGDELLQDASYCMQKVFGSYGKIYRTGGDEFSAILYLENKPLDEIKAEFERTYKSWKNKTIKSISISCGYVSSLEKDWDSIADIAILADERMYKEKNLYYKKKGIDRTGKAEGNVLLTAFCTVVLKANLKNDTYRIIKNDSGDSAFKEKKLSECLIKFGQNCITNENELKKYIKKVDLAQLIKTFDAKKPFLSIILDKLPNNLDKKIIQITPVTFYSAQNQTVYIYIK